MPPRVPTRALSSLSISQSSIASSSSLAGPPKPSSTSPRHSHRSLSTPSGSSWGSTSTSSRTHARAHLCSQQQTRSFHATSAAAASHKNPYEVLGVAKDASASDVKKAYYALAKKWHPDSSKEPSAAEKFHEIQNAYDILSDDTKRQAYDRYGSASTQDGFDADAFARGAAGGFGGFQDFGAAFGGRGGNTGDLFESLFGSAFGGGANPFGSSGGRQRPVRGDDLEATVTLAFLDACAGATSKITITPVVDCKPCSGSGLKPGEKKSTCTTCRGTGQQAFQVQGMFMASTCPTCNGTGSVIPRSSRCGECEGVGRVKERRVVDVEIPAGIEDGMKIKIPNGGDMPLSASGPPGDLYVRVNVQPSSVFRRQGTNLYHDAKVPLHVALLGGRVRVPTLEGEVDVRIREGTQYGEEAVLKGRGVKNIYGRKNERGDLVVSWKVQIPRSMSALQKKIVQAYADEVEGRHPTISFEPPAPATPNTQQAPTPEQASTEGRPSSHTSHTPPSPTPGKNTTSSSAGDSDGVGEKFASALGGAIGWAERLMGRGKDKDPKSGRGKPPRS